MPHPSISLRKHIRWLPSPASEPTSTLVLTSHTSHFIDIRLLNPSSASNTSAASFKTLNWAFAGTSQTTPPSTSSPETRAHTVWTHLIDSRTPHAPETVGDEGDIVPQTDGDSLELGSMINPATDKMAAYEELWTDFEIPPSLRYSVVLKTDGKRWEQGEKGMVVRVGEWCQGIITDAAGFCTVERWELSSVDNDNNGEGDVDEEVAWVGNWKRVARLGDGYLPCAPTIGKVDLKEGEEVDGTGGRWVVVESFSW